MIQGIASFPGVQHVASATVSFTHGISPSVFALEIAPQGGLISQTGTFALDFGGVHIEWPDCKVDYASLEWNGRGQIVRLNILDRRWKWAFGNISGQYNVYLPSGGLVDGTEATPAELAALCLDAMGETAYDTGDLPGEPRIEVDWSFDNPADMLASLCDTLGYRVVLQANNRVAIRRVGAGAELPDGAIQDDTLQIDPPELPDTIGILGAPVRFQDDVELEAVGIDSDTARTIVPINDLRYKPVQTWGVEFAGGFANVLSEYGEEAWKLAQQSVFRMYRVKFPAAIRGTSEDVPDMRHLIIEPGQVETFLNSENILENKPAQVLGTFYRWTDTMANTADKTVYDGDFRLDTRTGIVLFSQPVYRTLATTKMTPSAAILYLRTAYSVRIVHNRALFRTTVDRSTGGQYGTGTAWYSRPELVINYKDGKQQNEQEVRDEADFQLDAILASYQTETPQVRRYAGLVEVNLDGAIQHAVYAVGGQGATTTLSRSTEQRDYVLPWKRRRQMERQRQFEQFMADIRTLEPMG